MAELMTVIVPIVVAHVVVLVAMLLVIRKLLLSDTLHAVDRIKQVESEVRKKEEGIRREIEEHERDFDRRKTELQEDLDRRRAESEKESARAREQTIVEAKREGERIVEQARRNEEKLRQQIEQDMEEKAVEYGGEVFKLVFSEQMTTALDRQFIDELLDALAAVDATSITVDASQAEFAASHPLDAEQKRRLETLLSEKFGATLHVNEKIREDLLAGLVMKLGSLEIDGSLLNRYREAVGEVKKTARP